MARGKKHIQSKPLQEKQRMIDDYEKELDLLHKRIFEYQKQISKLKHYLSFLIPYL